MKQCNLFLNRIWALILAVALVLVSAAEIPVSAETLAGTSSVSSEASSAGSSSEKETPEAALVVKSAGTKLDITGETWYMLSGRDDTFKVRMQGCSSVKVKFTSSNKKIAKVTSAGKVTALRKGKAKITARGTAKDSSGKVCKFSVSVKIRVINSHFRKSGKYKGTGAWKSEINKLARKSKSKNKGRVIFYGSSSIRKWKRLAKDFPAVPVVNQGFGGSTVNDCLYYADKAIIPYAPEAIVFYAGTNDMAYGYSAGTIYARTLDFFNYIHCRLPDTKIIYLEQTRQPKRTGSRAGIKKLNKKVKAYAAKDPVVTYIETGSVLNKGSGSPIGKYFLGDGLHFTKKGYKAWTSAIRPDLYDELLKISLKTPKVTEVITRTEKEVPAEPNQETEGTGQEGADASGESTEPSGEGTEPANPTAEPQIIVTETKTLTVKLTWTKAKYASGYQIYRDGKRIATTNKLTYSDKGLKPGSGHKYKVRAFRKYKGSKRVYGPFSKTVKSKNNA